jgi:HD-GYP domain-containing protein (c-di-GMP phosphodiesterase class II)
VGRAAGAHAPASQGVSASLQDPLGRGIATGLSASLMSQERLDGSGYPDGLSGSAIPIEARMIAVADAVEAMSSHRPYRPAMGLEPALAEIAQGAGRLYDSDSVTACARVFAEGFALSE